MTGSERIREIANLTNHPEAITSVRVQQAREVVELIDELKLTNGRASLAAMLAAARGYQSTAGPLLDRIDYLAIGLMPPRNGVASISKSARRAGGCTSPRIERKAGHHPSVSTMTQSLRAATT
jgi:hypothetical protein